MTGPGTLAIRRADRNPHGGLDALYVLSGDAIGAPVTRIEGEAPAPAMSVGERRRLRLIHFNDFHHCLTLPDARGDSHLFSQIVQRHRAARAGAAADEIVLLVSGGDDHTGTALDELLGWAPGELDVDPAYAAYSAAGVDVAAMGNHELDRGAAVLQAGIRASARFPILSANLHGSRHVVPGRDYFPAAIGVARGLRIGFVGLITPVDTRTHTSDDPGIAVASPIEVLGHLLPAIARVTDVVIVMSHCGYGVDRNFDGKAGSVRFLAEGDVAIARAIARMIPGPVAIVGGHTHTVLNAAGFGPDTLIDGVPIVQAGGLASHVGEFAMTVTAGRSGRVEEPAARLFALGRRVPPPGAKAGETAIERDDDYDQDFEATVIAPLIERVRTRLDETLGQLVDPDGALTPEVTLRRRYMDECALANFIADALVARSADFAQGRAELAIVNSTAVGNGLAAGDHVSFRQWFAVTPFADTLQVAEINGAELERIVADNARRIVRQEEITGPNPIDVRGYVSRGLLHFSSGLRYTLRPGAGAAQATAEDIVVLGRPIAEQRERRFVVVLTNYLGAGGYGECWNGQPIPGVPGEVPSFDFRALPKRDTGLGFRNECIAFIRKAGVIGPHTGARLDGRLRLLGSG